MFLKQSRGQATALRDSVIVSNGRLRPTVSRVMMIPEPMVAGKAIHGCIISSVINFNYTKDYLFKYESKNK